MGKKSRHEDDEKEEEVANGGKRKAECKIEKKHTKKKLHYQT